LLDEPLSNLDLKLREAMRLELKEIQAALGMTFVYVTHDQEEAMAMSDRIVVMWQGEIAQEGRPGEIYRHPKSRFVADFIGRSNLIPISSVEASSDRTEVTLASTGRRLKSSERVGSSPPRFVCIRPEALRLGGEHRGENQLWGTLKRIVDLGAQLELAIEISADLTLSAVISSAQFGALPQLGDDVQIFIAAQDVTLLNH
jgi:ABC-type Fe3+/spermidine/putrescine transport system ATPase subunit